MWNFEEQVNHRKTHVHRDDLHALLWTNTTTSASAQTLSAGNDVYQRFITGSKDNQVRLWDISPSGSIELQGEVRTRGDSNSWITALTRAYTRDHFIYGTRDGVVGFIHSELGQIKQFPLPQRFNPKCKTKNQNRITTVYSMHEYDRDLHEYVLIGKPKSLLCARIQYNAQAQPKEEDKSNDDDNEKKQDAVGDKTMNLVIEYEEELHSNDWVSSYLKFHPIIK